MSERNNVLILLALFMIIGMAATAMQIFQGSDVNEITVSLNNTGNLDTPIQSITYIGETSDHIDFLNEHIISGYDVSLTHQATGTSGNRVGTNISYSFTENGTFETFANMNVDVLMVAGGGAGGGNGRGSGGGAGGVLVSPEKALTAQSYSITIGNGGLGTLTAYSNNGDDTTFAGLTAIGGGTGADYLHTSSYDGGSGGGGTINNPTGGLGTAGQGNNGGDGSTSFGGGGGGGGVGEVGGDAVVSSSAGDGGDGIQNAYSGINIWYGGGGAGSVVTGGYTPGTGGQGGGADGVNTGAGIAGTANTGGGGSGGTEGGIGGDGGSGIIIIRVNDPLKTLIVTPSDITRNLFSNSTGTYGSYPIIPAGIEQDFILNGTLNFNYTIDFTPTDLTVSSGSTTFYAGNSYTFNAVVSDHNTGTTMPTQPDKVKYRLVGAANTSVSSKEFVGTSITLPSLQKGTYTLFTSIGWDNIPTWSNEISQSVVITDAATPVQSVTAAITDALTTDSTDPTNDSTADILVGAPGRVVDGWKTMLDAIISFIKTIITNVSAVFS